MGLSFIVHRVANFFISRIIQRYWPKTGKWGINRETVFCAKCRTRQPKIRIPRNSHQLMWGGWSCSECGCEMDKYGQSR